MFEAAKVPFSIHENHVLFEHDFYLTKAIWALICLQDVTRESVTALTDYLADASVCENVTRIYEVLATL